MAPDNQKLSLVLRQPAPRSMSVGAAPILGFACVLGFACILGVAFSLGGCGFRLAGNEPLPVMLVHPYLSLKDPYTDFAREFERRLKSNDAHLMPNMEGASATIEVTQDQVVQRVLSVSAANIPTEYQLTYTVTFDVKEGTQEILAPKKIQLSRDFSFAENALLAKEHEADILRGQMALDLVSIVMRQLTSLK